MASTANPCTSDQAARVNIAVPHPALRLAGVLEDLHPPFPKRFKLHADGGAVLQETLHHPCGIKERVLKDRWG